MPSKDRKKIKKIPTHLIIGAPGSGKSTILTYLASLKPYNENWAVLINSGAALKSDLIDIDVVKLASCVCCSAANITEASIAQLIRRSKPDRLIIESSHPPRSLVDLLTAPNLAPAISLQPIVCTVSLSLFIKDPNAQLQDQNEPFWEQISICNSLIGTHADSATATLSSSSSPEAAVVEGFKRWADSWVAMITGSKKSTVVVSNGVSGRINDAEKVFGLGRRKLVNNINNKSSNKGDGRDKGVALLFEDVDWEEEFRKNALS